MPASNLPRRPLALATLKRLATSLLAVTLALAPAVTTAVADQPSHVILTRAQSNATQQLSVGFNKSMILDLPADVRQVIVSQPSIASALMQSKRRAVLQGMSIGDTNIFFLDDKGVQIATLNVSVVRDDSTLTSAIAKLIPGSAISIQAFGDHIILSGTAQSQDDVTKAMAIAGQFAGGDANIANIITVAGSQQVNLKVTVAEVSRSAVKQLGIDLSGSMSSGVLTTGLVSTEPLGGASNVVTGNTVTAGINVPGLSLKATLRALEQRGLMRTLDQPTLTAISGQPAEFLAGGEFPVPTSVDSATGQVSYAFKQFGVDLKFTPTVRSNGIVGLTIDTSVSEPTTDGAVTVGTLTIPALKNRQAKTTVELPVGSTLSIAGLYEDQERQIINSLPGVGNIPILGALFRSRDFIHQQTELVILVTPYLASAGPAPTLPTDGVVAAGDAEANFLGHMQKLYGVGDPNNTTGQYHGSVGFVLE
jgi:pilus assembly protein CpaC